MEVGLQLLVASIPIVFVGVFFFGAMYYFYKMNERRLETLEKLIERGENIDAELVDRLYSRKSDYKQDYKNGLIWIAIGTPGVIGLWIDGNTTGSIYMLIPVFVGIAYLLSGKFRLREPS